MASIFKHIKESMVTIFKVWRQEFWNVIHNSGVMIFFILLTTIYPIVYGFIFNPELVRDVRVVVIDNSRSSLSRQFIRDIDASQKIKVIGYAADLPEAQKAMHQKDCYGIIMLPNDFEKNIERGEQTNVIVYCDMSLLLRYKAILSGVNQVGLAKGAQIQTSMADNIGASSYIPTSGINPIPSFSFAMGDTQQGFASFIIPGILIMILQQSMLLGIGMLGGAEHERRRKNNGNDPQSVNTGAFHTLIGRALCYFMIYVPSTIYILYFVPRMFLYPQAGSLTQILLFMIPYLFACIFFGMALQIFIKHREDVFPIVVVPSIVLLFISGLTWPRYAMSPLWRALGFVIPSTWGVEGFIGMNSNGASISDISSCFYNIWILCIAYFIIAYFIYRLMAFRRGSRPLISK